LLWETLILGLLVGWLRNGRIKQLNQVHINSWPLIIIAVSIQGLIWFDFHYKVLHLSAIYPFLYIGSFIILLASIIPFMNNFGLMVVGTGILLNLVVIAVNGGMMPVDGTALPPDILKELAAGEKSPFHKPMDEDTLFVFLGDRISIFYRPNQLLSVGDLFIGGGIFLFVQQKMLKKRKRRKKKGKH